MKFGRKETVQARWEGTGDVLLVDLETERILLTNEAGLIVWWLCDGSRTMDEILGELERHYLMTTEAKESIKAFLEQLCLKGFVRREEDG